MEQPLIILAVVVVVLLLFVKGLHSIRRSFSIEDELTPDGKIKILVFLYDKALSEENLERLRRGLSEMVASHRERDCVIELQSLGATEGTVSQIQSIIRECSPR